jgi:undecaprenyl-diphosphatase
MLATITQPLFLGFLQGFTEFLPISSSAHLILAPRLMHWTDPGLAFDVALHLGTLAGVVIYFWKDLWTLTQGILQFRDVRFESQRRLVGLLVVATVPAAVAGLLLEKAAESSLRSPVLIGFTLIVMGLVLAAADYFSSGKKSLRDLTWPVALGIGCAQSLALIPGVSRSGATITLALFLGLSRSESARFSFLMSVPIIAGAGLLKFHQLLRSPEHLAILVGFLGAAVSGFLAIWGLMRFVQTHRYTPFVVYRIVLGILVLTHLSKFLS